MVQIDSDASHCEMHQPPAFIVSQRKRAASAKEHQKSDSHPLCTFIGPGAEIKKPVSLINWLIYVKVSQHRLRGSPSESGAHLNNRFHRLVNLRVQTLQRRRIGFETH